MNDRLHILLSAEEKERYRALAQREGRSLSDWVRGVVREAASRHDDELRLDTRSELEAFFAAIDEREGEDAPLEPDWEEHRALISEGFRGVRRPT